MSKYEWNKLNSKMEARRADDRASRWPTAALDTRDSQQRQTVAVELFRASSANKRHWGSRWKPLRQRLAHLWAANYSSTPSSVSRQNSIAASSESHSASKDSSCAKSDGMAEAKESKACLGGEETRGYDIESERAMGYDIESEGAMGHSCQAQRF